MIAHGKVCTPYLFGQKSMSKCLRWKQIRKKGILNNSDNFRYRNYSIPKDSPMLTCMVSESHSK